MPGIAGIVHKSDEILLDKMLSSIKHENWYKTDKCNGAFFSIGRVHLGTFNSEPQPIFNENKSLCIFFDGKIYGYNNKMEELKRKGHKFHINNDAEFCLHLYEEQETRFIKKLNGSFLLVICDLVNNDVMIANDRYGSRPHYYTIHNSKLLFAPEAKAILQDRSFNKKLNYEAVADFFAFGYMLGNKTLFKNIKTIPPASLILYNGKKLIKQQYWDFNYKPDYDKSEEELVDELVRTYKKGVEIRMNHTLSSSVSLSGGLDSRSIIAAMHKDKRKDVLAFSFGTPGCDEIKIAEKVAKRAGTKFKSIEWRPNDFLTQKNMESVVWFTEGNDHIGVSYLPYVCKKIEKDIDIIYMDLDNDQLLGGSRFYDETFNVTTEEQLIEFLNRKIRLFTENDFKELFTDNFYKIIKDKAKNHLRNEIKKIKEKHLANKSDHFFQVNRQRRYTQFGWVIVREKKEVICPSLDNDYINTISKIPPELRINHKIYRKFLIKLSLELAKIPYHETMIRADFPLICWGLSRKFQLGKEGVRLLIWRLSKGKILFSNKRYCVDYDKWLLTNKNWRKYLKELLLSNDSFSKKYVYQDYITKLFQEHNSGKRNSLRKILYLATFELYLRLFFSDNMHACK